MNSARTSDAGRTSGTSVAGVSVFCVCAHPEFVGRRSGAGLLSLPERWRSMLTPAERAICQQLDLSESQFAEAAGSGATALRANQKSAQDLIAAGGDCFLNDQGRLDEAGLLVADAVMAGAVPTRLAARYARVIRQDLPAGRQLLQGMIADAS